MNSLNNKKILFKKEKISFKFINRNNDITLFCIHGINSSKDFVGNLKKYETKYNIFTYSYGDMKELKIQKLIALTHYIINNHFKNKKLIIIAHSFGAYISIKLFNNSNIIKYIFINPIHPLTFEYKPFLKTISFAKKKLDFFQKNKLLLQKEKSFLEIYEKRFKWYNILLDISDKIEILKKDLQYLINMKEKSIFIISKGDFIISGKLLQKFLSEKKILPKMIKYTGHSPLIKETKKTYELFDI